MYLETHALLSRARSSLKSIFLFVARPVSPSLLFASSRISGAGLATGSHGGGALGSVAGPRLPAAHTRRRMGEGRFRRSSGADRIAGLSVGHASLLPPICLHACPGSLCLRHNRHYYMFKLLIKPKPTFWRRIQHSSAKACCGYPASRRRSAFCQWCSSTWA